MFPCDMISEYHDSNGIVKQPVFLWVDGISSLHDGISSLHDGFSSLHDGISSLQISISYSSVLNVKIKMCKRNQKHKFELHVIILIFEIYENNTFWMECIYKYCDDQRTSFFKRSVLNDNMQ